ncbi:DUF7093 family protein [Halopiger djelfimassiliensis]|uniref:DUF7093 family protein n=1 Tax=Halopiger djelfimassiliensis TaxID=1293047 RepID=UPI000678155F|nr:hypothetical protein [Halopiger djelfimassiliensis]
MVLRCSLLGHDYGEAEVEREREERGSEVVVTVQEYEECSRCGERNIISENTEVTSISAETNAPSPPDEPMSDAQPDPETADSSSDRNEESGGPDDESEDDAEFIDAAEPESPATADAEGDPESSIDDGIEVPTDENGDPVTDDGEILDDDGDDPATDRDRDRGEWPESEDVGPPVGASNDPEEWPETDRDDDLSVDGEPVDDDAVVLEHDAPTGTRAVDETVDMDAVAAEAATRGASDDADRESGSAGDSGTGIERAGAAPTPGEEATGPSDDSPTEFYCPRCEYVAAGDRGSLRAGDICPDCRKGYLGERPLQ